MDEIVYVTAQTKHGEERLLGLGDFKDVTHRRRLFFQRDTEPGTDSMCVFLGWHRGPKKDPQLASSTFHVSRGNILRLMEFIQSRVLDDRCPTCRIASDRQCPAEETAHSRELGHALIGFALGAIVTMVIITLY